MRLIRRVQFSAGHRYWFDHLSAEENKALFGPWTSPYNHGHNYVLDITAEGEVDESKGMVVNIKDIDALLKREVVSRFHHKSINDEVAGFDRQAPTMENLLPYLAALLEPSFSGAGDSHIPARITHLRLEEMPDFYSEMEFPSKMITLTRVYEFAAAHRLNVEALSQEKNFELFGKCNNPSGHGHNYLVEVTVTGDVDPQTGMIVDICAIDDVVNREVVERYDHKNLNCDLPEFAGKVTTSEVVTQAIWDRLDGALPATLHRVRLFETARSAFEVTR